MEDIFVIGENGDGVDAQFVLRGIPAENGDGTEVEITVGTCSWCGYVNTENVSVAGFCVGADGDEHWYNCYQLCPYCMSFIVTTGRFPQE
jgi:hypothetical protein